MRLRSPPSAPPAPAPGLPPLFQDEEEATTLLSAASCALADSRLPWPLLMPVHDALRDAYWGCAAAVLPGQGAVRLRTDSVHISSLPPGMLTLQVSSGLSAPLRWWRWRLGWPFLECC